MGLREVRSHIAFVFYVSNYAHFHNSQFTIHCLRSQLSHHQFVLPPIKSLADRHCKRHTLTQYTFSTIRRL